MFEQNCYDGNNVIENRYDSIKRILDNKNDGYDYYTPSIFGKTNENLHILKKSSNFAARKRRMFA